MNSLVRFGRLEKDPRPKPKGGAKAVNRRVGGDGRKKSEGRTSKSERNRKAGKELGRSQMRIAGEFVRRRAAQSTFSIEHGGAALRTSAFGLRFSAFFPPSSLGLWSFSSLRASVFGLCLTAAFLIVGGMMTAAKDIPVPSSPLPGAELFKEQQVRQISIEIPPEGIRSLRRDPRQFVVSKVTEAGVVYPNVAVHLKGSTGSFRPVDDKPALTLDFAHFERGQKFHGLRRIHLNNSVEDPSYMNEMLGGELFRAGGVPAPRVTHALVTLNGRRLGLYVLVEGFTEDFLACHFKLVSGDLYEPRNGHDVGRFLKRNSVEAPKRGRSDFEALAEAAQDADLDRRWRRLQTLLDMNRVIPFMATEIMICHRDGYCLARNNFRIYEELDRPKILFFPHGMDQLFGIPDLPWEPTMSGLVAKAILEVPEGKRRYRNCLAQLVETAFDCRALSNHVARIETRLASCLTPDEIRSIREAAAAVQKRLFQRKQNLEQQLARPELRLLDFTDGVAHLVGWERGALPGLGEMQQTTFSDGTPALKIVAGGVTAADWRTKALLGPGRYRFEGRSRVAGVKPLPFGGPSGARLRIAGEMRQSPGLTGDAGWQLLGVDFEVDRVQIEIEFLCELRAGGGDAWFDADSLRVRKLP